MQDRSIVTKLALIAMLHAGIALAYYLHFAQRDAEAFRATRTSALILPSLPFHEAGRLRGLPTAQLASVHNCFPPTYPPAAAAAGTIGTAYVAILIDGDGAVIDKKLRKSSGNRELDHAAMAVLATCKYKPPSTDSRAAPTWRAISYTWTLD